MTKRPKGDSEFDMGKQKKPPLLPLYLDKELFTLYRRYMEAKDPKE